MGGNNTKQSLPIPLILKRLNECMIPDERETIFDYFEMLDSKLISKETLVKNSTIFKEQGGVEVIFKFMKAMLADDVCISLCVQIFDRCKTKVNVVMDFIQFGGLDILERVMKDHEKNKILMSEVNKLLKSVLLIGARAAVSEISQESELIVMCQACQEALERKRRLKSTAPVSDTKPPTPLDRIRRVLTFMRNYHDKVEVLEVGLDACISFAGNTDSKACIGDTPFIEAVSKAIRDHGQHEAIMWRACVALSTVASFSQDIAGAIARENVHELLCEHFASFAENPYVQMNMLWLFDALLRWQLGPSRRRIWQSQRCIDLFMAFTAKREKLLSKAMLADKYLPYKVVLPLSVRSFLRETGGELLPEDLPPPVVLRDFPKRRNFDEHPKFGVIDDKAIKDGEKGLVDHHVSKKLGGVPEPKRDWEDSLTYGQPKNSKK